LNKESEMPLSNQADVMITSTSTATPQTADSGKHYLGGACRLPVKTADTGRIRLGGACRLPAIVADSGRIRLGGACRLPVRST
jgi:hypothetical protein